MNEKLIIALAALLIVIALVILLQTKYKKQAAGALLYLVTRAEQQLGGGTGLKYSAVTMWLYEQLLGIASRKGDRQTDRRGSTIHEGIFK